MSKSKNGVERDGKLFDTNSLLFRTNALTCFNTTLSKYLKTHGVEMSESDIYFIGGHISPDSSIFNVRMRRLQLPYVQFDVLINSLFSETNTSYEMLFNKEYEYVSAEVNPSIFKNKNIMLAMSTVVLNHLLFPGYPHQGTIHCIVSTGINGNNIMKITDFYNVDDTGKINIWEGDYDYATIKDGLFGYLYIKSLDKEMLEKKKANILSYAMKEFEALVYDTGANSSSGLGYIDELFDHFEEDNDEGKESDQRDIYRMNLMLQAKHLLFFDYTIDLISKHPLKDGDYMCRRLKEMKYAWQKLINKLLIQTIAYNKKRTTRIIFEARNLLKQQRELVLQLIEILRQEYKL